MESALERVGRQIRHHKSGNQRDIRDTFIARDDQRTRGKFTPIFTDRNAQDFNRRFFHEIGSKNSFFNLDLVANSRTGEHESFATIAS